AARRGGRQGRRSVRAREGREGDVGAQYRIRSGRDAATERHQLERVESRVPRGDHRESDVRIALRVAVAGEVLEGREHSVVVQPADVFLHQPRDRPRVLPEGADVDDGIQGVVVDVRVRGEIK